MFCFLHEAYKLNPEQHSYLMSLNFSLPAILEIPQGCACAWGAAVLLCSTLALLGPAVQITKAKGRFMLSQSQITVTVTQKFEVTDQY